MTKYKLVWWESNKKFQISAKSQMFSSSWSSVTLGKSLLKITWQISDEFWHNGMRILLVQPGPESLGFLKVFQKCNRLLTENIDNSTGRWQNIKWCGGNYRLGAVAAWRIKNWKEAAATRSKKYPPKSTPLFQSRSTDKVFFSFRLPQQCLSQHIAVVWLLKCPIRDY